MSNAIIPIALPATMPHHCRSIHASKHKHNFEHQLHKQLQTSVPHQLSRQHVRARAYGVTCPIPSQTSLRFATTQPPFETPITTCPIPGSNQVSTVVQLHRTNLQKKKKKADKPATRGSWSHPSPFKSQRPAVRGGGHRTTLTRSGHTTPSPPCRPLSQVFPILS